MQTTANGIVGFGGNMLGKKWKLIDTDGNDATDEDVKQLTDWLTHDKSRPIVYAQQAEGKSILSFEDPGDRPTFLSMASKAQHMESQYKDLRTYVDAVGLSVEAKDWKAVRKMYGHKD